jgi:ATP-dependent RNA helicase DDX35
VSFFSSGTCVEIPQYLYEAGWAQGSGRCIACTQPRRIAAVSLAQRVALEQNQSKDNMIQGPVGYSIRFDDQSSPLFTKIKFLTDGRLIRETLSDPLLTQYSVIMVDEAHEMSINTEILLGLLKK